MSNDNGKFLPSTNPNSGANSTEADVWSHAPRGTSAAPAYNSAADAAAARAERERMVEAARVQGEMQSKRPQLPHMDHNIFDMVPPEYRASHAEAHAYIQAMEAVGNGGNRRNLDSTQLGALPVDARILDDTRSPVGFPRSVSELTPDCTVSYQGTRITVEQAVREGLLEVDAYGRYSVPNAAAREAQQRQQEEQQAEQQATQIEALRVTGDEPDAEAQQAVDLLNKVIPGQATNVFIQDYINNDGTLSSANIDRVAQSVGITSEQAHALAHQVVTGLTRQAHTATVHAGVSAGEVEAAWTWAQQTVPVEHAQAVSAFIRGSDAKGIKDLAKRYLAYKRDAARR